MRIGWGLTIAAEIGCLVGTYSMGFDYIWFNKNVKNRKNGKSFHAYTSAGSHPKASIKNNFIKNLKKDAGKVFSASGLRTLSKHVIDNAKEDYLHVTLSAVCFWIMANPRKFKKHTDYNGDSSYTMASVGKLVAVRGSGAKCKTYGAGVGSTYPKNFCKTISLSTGVTHAEFNRVQTKFFRGVFPKNQVKTMAKKG